MNFRFKARRLIATIISAALMGLATLASAADKPTIGVAMPNKSTLRWVADGANMVKTLEAKGYQADLEYAEDDIPTQLAQIENMLTKNVKVLVIAAIDGTALTKVLQQAHDAKVRVIAYDRLINGSPNVDYYATFDNFKVGVLQGQSIEKHLGLKEGKGPFNIELFGGAPDDNNAFFFYNGAMSVLQPYIDKKKLVVQSGQTGMKTVGTPHWDGATAQSRMDNLLSGYYTEKHVDAVLAPNDDLAIGVLSSLKGVGYGSGETPMPVVTGQDASIPSVKSIIAHEQTSTIFKDTRELAKVAATMVDALVSGSKPEVNDTKTYNNGVKVVPSYLLKPVLVTADNYKQVLVDSGYYKEEELK